MLTSELSVVLQPATRYPPRGYAAWSRRNAVITLSREGDRPLRGDPPARWLASYVSERAGSFSWEFARLAWASRVTTQWVDAASLPRSLPASGTGGSETQL